MRESERETERECVYEKKGDIERGKYIELYIIDRLDILSNIFNITLIVFSY